MARPVGRLERAVKWVKRKLMVASLSALVIVIGLTAAGLVLYQLEETKDALDKAQKSQKAEAEQTKKAQAASIKGNPAVSKSLGLGRMGKANSVFFVAYLRNYAYFQK